MIYNRQNFIDLWSGKKVALDQLFMIEQIDNNHEAQWFVCIKPIDNKHFQGEAKYWRWCDENCTGKLYCYSSSSELQQEWWGFSDYDDIPLWLLKWA